MKKGNINIKAYIKVKSQEMNPEVSSPVAFKKLVEENLSVMQWHPY